jgi:hypothetical protein
VVHLVFGRNPFRVESVCGELTQGSAWRATLGWRMESLWDSQGTQIARRPLVRMRGAARSTPI